MCVYQSGSPCCVMFTFLSPSAPGVSQIPCSNFPLTCHKHGHFLYLSDNNKRGGPVISNFARAVLFLARGSFLILVSAGQDLGA